MFELKYLGLLLFCYLIVHFLYVIVQIIGLAQFNPFKKLNPLTEKEKTLLGHNFSMYNSLPENYKKKLHHRIVWLRTRKKYVFHGKVERQDDLKLVLSATLAFITLGLKKYRMIRSLLRVIVYPTQYYSKINRRHHLGEYNPSLKTLVFSADKIWEGFKIPSDNKNLAIHETAHALSFEMLKKGSWEARRFRVGFRKIRALFEKDTFRTKLVESQYFREYGMTNLQEFFSVAVENYFETPSIFYVEFPELFEIIQSMLNFDYQLSCVFVPSKILPES